MLNYKPPKTRRKPTDTEKATYDTEYNLQNGIPQVDDQQQEQDYKVCFTDIDLAGQVETRQSTSGLMIYLNGILVHWRARKTYHTNNGSRRIRGIKQRKHHGKV
jgi:hypothetical protein